MADQKQQQKPRSQSSFWTVAETFGSHFAEAGVGFMQSCLVRGIAIGLATVSGLFLVFCAASWYINDDMPEIFYGALGPGAILLVAVSIGIFLWAGKIQDIEVLQRWSEDVREDRQRPAMPASVTIVNSTAGALPSNIEDQEEEA